MLGNSELISKPSGTPAAVSSSFALSRSCFGSGRPAVPGKPFGIGAGVLEPAPPTVNSMMPS
jgi:hypothetical protein